MNIHIEKNKFTYVDCSGRKFSHSMRDRRTFILLSPYIIRIYYDIFYWDNEKKNAYTIHILEL